MMGDGGEKGESNGSDGGGDGDNNGDGDDGGGDGGALPGPATSVRTVRVADEFPSCLLVKAFAHIVYFLYGSA